MWNLRTFIAAALSAAALLLAAVPPNFAAASPPTSAHVCIIATWALRTVAERHAFDELAQQRYPATNWSLSLLPGLMSARTSVQGYVLHPRPCDVLIGAGGSTATLAVSPLVPTSTAWTDASATSQELTSTANHPSFNRVVPGDDVGGKAMARIAYNVGWRSVSILCENSAFGRSLVDAFSDAMHALGGSIDTVLCWESDATEDQIRTRVPRLLSQRKSRAVFIAASAGSHSALALERLHEQAIILVQETCVATVKTMPGLICGLYAPDPARYGAFRASLQARDMARLLPEFAAVGLADAAAIAAAQTANDVYAALAYDGLQHAMHGVYTYPDANRTAYPTMAEYLRGYSTNGLTGTVSLTPEGNRISATMNILQSHVDARTGEVVTSIVAVGDTSSVVLQPFNATAGRPAQFYWFNKTFSNAFADNVIPVDVAENSAAAIYSSLIALVLVAILAVVGIRYLTRPQPLEHAPLDDALPLAVLFVGLANESVLSDHFTRDSIDAATHAMAKLVRKAIRTSKCYEAQRVNDGTFMIVAKTPDRALACAALITRTINVPSCSVNSKLVVAPTDEEEAEATRHATEHKTAFARSSRRGGGGGRSQSPSHSAESRQSRMSGSVRRGGAVPSVNGGTSATVRGGPGTAAAKVALHQLPRVLVSAGVAHGFAAIDHDEEHGVLSYRGPLLAVAAVATDAGVPGQIVATEDVLDALQEDSIDVPGTFDAYLANVSAATGVTATTADTTAATAGGNATDADTATDAARSAHRSSKSGSRRSLTLFTYTTPAATPAEKDASTEVLDAIDARRAAAIARKAEGGDDTTELTTGIATALTRAATGVSARRCAIAMVHLPVLTSDSGGDNGGGGSNHAKRVTAALSTLAWIAARHKCHVHDVIGTTVVVSANAVGPVVSIAPIRITQFARDFIETMCDGRIAATAAPAAVASVSVGIAAGAAAAVGAVENMTVVSGALAEHARLAQAAARNLGLSCVLAVAGASPTDSDVAAQYVLIPVDVAAFGRASTTTTAAARGRGPSSAKASKSHGIALLCSVEHARDGDDGEWLYAFRDEDTGSLSARSGEGSSALTATVPNGVTWQSLLLGEGPQPPATAASAPALGGHDHDHRHQQDTSSGEQQPAAPVAAVTTPPAAPIRASADPSQHAAPNGDGVATLEDDVDAPPPAVAISELRLRAAWFDAGGLRGYAAQRGSELRGELTP